MSKLTKDDWLRDVRARQRNVVFPDTVQNEARFWRNAWSGVQSLSLAQWVGVLMMLVSFGSGLAFVLLKLWPEGQAPWWQKLIDAYGVYIVVIGAGATIIAVGNRKARRRLSKH